MRRRKKNIVVLIESIVERRHEEYTCNESESSSSSRNRAIDQSISSHPDHGILVIFLDNNIFCLIGQRRETKGKSALAREGEDRGWEWGEGGDAFLHHSSWQSRERKGEREREGEIGRVRVDERERSSERTRERTMKGREPARQIY